MGASASPRRRTGRKPALTPEVERRLLDAVRAGVPLKTAVVYAGVHEATLYRWLERGAAEQARQTAKRTDAQRAERGEPPAWVEEPFREFRDRLMRARAEVAARNVMHLNKAAAGGYVVKRRTTTLRDGSTVVEEEFAPVAWQAAKWLLEKSFPRDFGPGPDIDPALFGQEDPDRDSDDIPQDAAARIAAQIARAHRMQREIEAARPVEPGDDVQDAEVVS